MGRFAGACILPDLERVAQVSRDEYVRQAAQEAIEQNRQICGKSADMGEK